MVPMNGMGSMRSWNREVGYALALRWRLDVIIIIIRNSYIAPNPTRLAQSTSQFKIRMDIRINT